MAMSFTYLKKAITASFHLYLKWSETVKSNTKYVKLCQSLLCN